MTRISVPLNEWRGCAIPARIPLEGRWCRLEPLNPADADSLFEASVAQGVEERFRYLFSPPPDRVAFDEWMRQSVHSLDPMFWGVIDRRSGRCEGRQSLMRIEANHGVIEIGHILWGPAIARSRVATEAFFLHAQYVFETLGYRRFEWKCNALNERSRQAANRFGFTFEGIFRQHMVVKGENRDTAWFAMLDQEWPETQSAFHRWLDPANFDSEGQQKCRLSEFLTR